MRSLGQRVWTAHGDAWQVQGRLRAHRGGGAAEWPGIRLMASGLPHAQWNNGDVTDPAKIDWPRVRAWYAGHGNVPWGVRVPAELAFERGRHRFRKRCMALLPERFSRFACPRDVSIRRATAADLETLVRIDCAAFEGEPGSTRGWIAPQLESTAACTVAIAAMDTEAVGIATAVFSDDRAGPCVGIFGVGVLEHARRRGIARALTSHLLERAFDAGVPMAHLNPDSDAAAELYRQLGFVETPGLDIYTDL
jgi:ribosomal protein S18 acetylase RimI-like enzyme